MSLQGTFDTLSVTEVFGLLSTAGKTGALRLEAGERAASVFVTAGLCCAVETDDLGDSTETGGELATRLIDVGFDFARRPSGSFRFNDSELDGHPIDLTTPLEPAIAEIRSLVEQWREIELTIPSLDVHVRLAAVLRGEEIVLTAHEWSLLVALDGTPTVRELIERRHQPMIQVCRDLKGLVDRGAIEVGVDVAVAAPSAVPAPDPTPVVANEAASARAQPAAAHAIEPTPPYAPEADEAISVAEVHAAAVEADAVAAGLVSHMTRSRPSTPDVFAVEAAEIDDEIAALAVTRTSAEADAASAADASQDRGALLRLFSALKEN